MKIFPLKPTLSLFWRAVGVLALLLLVGGYTTPVLFASEICENNGQVIPKGVCDFDSFYGGPPRQIPNGWTPFIIWGELTYMQDVDTYWGAPSLRMWSNGGTFKAGIYTQVNVTPGAGYRASIAWGAPNEPDHFGRQLGIDPTGGTDPNAPTVIWGHTHWGAGRMLNYPEGKGPNIDVRARALNSTVTVFFMVDHPTSTGDNLIFVDAIALYPDEGAPQIDPPTATPEPTPLPTDTPAVIARAVEVVQIPPTATFTPQPLATATETPVPTETPTPTDTPTSTATPSPTPSPTFTPSPTWTPWATVTPEPLAIGNQAASGPTNTLALVRALAEESGRQNLLLFGLIGLSGVSLCGSSLWWLRRRI